MKTKQVVLAVIRREGEDDGIAYVAKLLERALAEMWSGRVLVEALEPARDDGVSMMERASFFARILRSQLTANAAWILFNHLGIARTQLAVPLPIRQPYAVVLHGTDAWGSPLSASQRKVLAGARLRLAVSRHTAACVEASYPSIGPIVSCPLGLLPDSLSSEEAVDGAVLARIRPVSAVIVGRLSSADRYKGHDQLIECWPRLLARIPGAQLVIVGRGDDRDRLRRKAAARAVEDHVLFTGFVSRSTLKAILSRARAFAMPSSGEGFGLVYLEAMRAGLPCLGSTADAAGDVIVPGRTGLLVSPDDPSALLASLESLLGRPDRAREMGREGRRRYDQMFTYDSFRRRLRPILRRAFEAV